MLVIDPPYFLAQQSYGGPYPDVARLEKQFRSVVLNLFHPDGGQLRTHPGKRRLEIYPELKGNPIRLASLGFHRRSPSGPHFLTDPKRQPGGEPHQALSCLVHVVEPVRGRDEEMADCYQQLSADGLVRPRDELVEKWLKWERIMARVRDRRSAQQRTVFDWNMGERGRSARSAGS